MVHCFRCHTEYPVLSFFTHVHSPPSSLSLCFSLLLFALSMTLFSERSRIDERNDAVARPKGGLYYPPLPRATTSTHTIFSTARRTLRHDAALSRWFTGCTHRVKRDKLSPAGMRKPAREPARSGKCILYTHVR